MSEGSMDMSLLARDGYAGATSAHPGSRPPRMRIAIDKHYSYPALGGIIAARKGR